MHFTYCDLGQRQTGEILEVRLQGNAANVKLMDSINFSKYRNGRGYHSYGTYVTRSPYRVTIPRTGRWYIAIDLGRHGGYVNGRVKVLPKP